MNAPNRIVHLTTLVVGASVLFAGCAPRQATHDVAYYRAHAQDRGRVLSDCANDPGSRGQEPDCLNAREAERLEGIGSLKDLPPMILPGSQSNPSTR